MRTRFNSTSTASALEDVWMRRILTAGIALSACVLLPVTPAAAQQEHAPAAQAQAAQTPRQGPLVLEPIRSGYVIATEVRVTRVDGMNRSLFGGYGGWVIGNSFVIGAGGYWLADRRTPDTRMFYGGVVAGLSVPAGRAVRVGVRGLVGYGQATLPVTARPVPDHPDWDWDWGDDLHRDHRDAAGPRFRREFVIAEPQAEVTVRLGPWISLDAGVGYRAIGEAGGLERRLRGAFGSIGVRIGPRG
jgi:hypothetical protein